MENKMNDVIVLGGGPAALSATLYLARYKRNCLLLTDSYGGQAATAGIVENYPGIKSTDGAGLIAEMKEQAKSAGAQMKEGEPAQKIEKGESGFKVVTSKGKYETKAILIATGKNPRKLGIEGEDQLIGRGLSYCATCDSPFAKDKEIAIVGGGNAAAKSALVAEKYATRVTIVNLNEELVSETVTLEKIKSIPKITVLPNAKTTSFITKEGRITGLKYQDTKSEEEKEIPVQMIFVEIGQIPNSSNFSDFIELNNKGDIKIDTNNQTSVKGVYAAGDVTEVYAKQIVVAAGEGAKAAIALNSYLENN